MKKITNIILLSCLFLTGLAAQTASNSYIKLEYDGAGNRVKRIRVINGLTSNSFKEAQTGVNAYAVYPNPSNGSLTLSLDAIEKGDGSLSVLDVQGRTVANQPFGIQKGTQQQSLELNHLPAGIYYVRLQIGNNRPVTEKIVIVEE